MIKPTDLQNGMVTPDELLTRRAPEPLTPAVPTAVPPCEDREPVASGEDDEKKESP